MLLCISLTLALISGLLQPFATRLQDTSLWVGKALTPDDAKTAYPRGIQDALTSGWPSVYIFGMSLLPLTCAVIGFFYAWWAGILSFVLATVFNLIFDKTTIASNKVERYIAILGNHARNRVADYTKKGDSIRAESAEELSKQLQNLLLLYLNSNVIVPNHNEAKQAPFGNSRYLLEMDSDI